LIELVRLYHQCRPWLAKIALHGDAHEIPAPHVPQPSTSDKAASMKPDNSASAWSAAETSLA
jgi:hypothetical protein